MIDLRHVDCMEYLATCEDNAFELAIVDPPYMDMFQTSNWVDTRAKQKEYKNREDTLTGKKPSKAYFNELKRVSKNQIVWGGNYFSLPISRGWIFWLKGMQKNYFSDGELAWSSFDRVLKCFDFTWSGMLQGDMKNKEERIHPTQKPVKLYEWLLMNYAKEGDRILDTHLGSGSIAIACHNLGFDLVGCELDEDYYKGACERLERHKAQLRMF
jgi:site-specific DNA-methyltransferase (adenine-specific)